MPKGLALYHSLARHCPDFRLFVLCLSEECYSMLSELSLENVVLISLKEIEASDEKLLEAKKNRTLVEYYFTLTPSLPLYILNHYPEVQAITYLDSDLYFYDDPKPIFEEIADNSVAIISHRFSRETKAKAICGKFNVGWITFRRDENGLACLNWYREKCLEWCYDRVEPERYADQKYLDYFQDRFQKVVEIQNKGANLAPWNIDNYNIRINGGKIYVDDEKLVFFHFNGLKHILGPLYDSGFADYSANFSKVIRKYIYSPYLSTLVCLNKKIRSNGKVGQLNGIREKEDNSKYAIFHRLFPKFFKILKKIKATIDRTKKVLITGTYIWCCKY